MDNSINSNTNTSLNKRKPILIMLIGLNGSDRSYYVEDVNKFSKLKSDIENNLGITGRIKHGQAYFDFEEYRKQQEEKCGNVLEEHVVLNNMMKDAKEELKQGRDVVFNHTNHKMKTRKGFLTDLDSSKVNCYKVAVFFATPYEDCLENLPQEQHESVFKMYKKFNVPYYFEGWDKIYPVVPTEKIRDEESKAEFNLHKLFNNNFAPVKYPDGQYKERNVSLNTLKHECAGHKETVGQHCRMTSSYLEEYCALRKIDYSYELFLACLLHDVGKAYTKSYVYAIPLEPSSGYKARYYGHENVGAYIGFIYQYLLHDTIEDTEHYLKTSQLIAFHMLPKTSGHKGLEKYRKLFGEDFFNELMILNKMDELARE